MPRQKYPEQEHPQQPGLPSQQPVILPPACQIDADLVLCLINAFNSFGVDKLNENVIKDLVLHLSQKAEISDAEMQFYVKVSANDQLKQYLQQKLVPGAGITFTVLNPGGIEQIQIDAAGGPAVDEKVKITALDTTADVLNVKIAAGAGIGLTVLNPGFNEQLQIMNTAPVPPAPPIKFSMTADVPPWTTAVLAVPSHPDVSDVWIRDDFTNYWNRLADQSDEIAKKIMPPTPGPFMSLWSSALGNDSGMSAPYLFTCYVDPAIPAYILTKYDAYTLALISQIPLLLPPGQPYGEPIVMFCPTFPYQIMVFGVWAPPGPPPPVAGCALASFNVFPDGLMVVNHVGFFTAASFDAANLGVHPNYTDGSSGSKLRLYGTFISDGFSLNGVSAVLALKLQFGPAINQSEPTLVVIPVSGPADPAPVPVFGMRSGFVDADSLDVVQDPSALPSSLLWLTANFRWTNAGLASLDLYKFSPPPVGWTPLPAPLIGFPPPPVWFTNIDNVTQDGMEFARGMIALDAGGRDSLAVVYVKDTFMGPVNIPLQTGPAMHRPFLNWATVQGIAAGPVTLAFNGIVNDEEATTETLANGEFGRQWVSTSQAEVYYLDPKWSSDRTYLRRTLFDSTGPIGTSEDIFSLPTSWATPSIGMIRPAFAQDGIYDPRARAVSYLSSIWPYTPFAEVVSLDSVVKPAMMRAYYNAGSLVFENNSPFQYRVKLVAGIW